MLHLHVRSLAAATALVVVLLMAGCVGPGGNEPPEPVVAIAGGAHCGHPPERAGAVVLARDGDDGHRVRLGMGRRPTGGYAVELAEDQPAAVDDGTAVVRVHWRVPASGEAVTQALTRPCVEVAVPSGYEGIRFIDQNGVVRGEVDLGR